MCGRRYDIAYLREKRSGYDGTRRYLSRLNRLDGHGWHSVLQRRPYYNEEVAIRSLVLRASSMRIK